MRSPRAGGDSLHGSVGGVRPGVPGSLGSGVEGVERDGPKPVGYSKPPRVEHGGEPVGVGGFQAEREHATRPAFRMHAGPVGRAAVVSVWQGRRDRETRDAGEARRCGVGVRWTTCRGVDGAPISHRIRCTEGRWTLGRPRTRGRLRLHTSGRCGSNPGGVSPGLSGIQYGPAITSPSRSDRMRRRSSWPRVRFFGFA